MVRYKTRPTSTLFQPADPPQGGTSIQPGGALAPAQSHHQTPVLTAPSFSHRFFPNTAAGSVTPGVTAVPRDTGCALRRHTAALAHGSPGSRRFTPGSRRFPPRGAPPLPPRSRAAPAALSSARTFQRVPHARRADPGAAPAGGLAFPPPCPEPARAGGGAAGCSMEARPQPRHGT